MQVMMQLEQRMQFGAKECRVVKKKKKRRRKLGVGDLLYVAVARVTLPGSAGRTFEEKQRHDEGRNSDSCYWQSKGIGKAHIMLSQSRADSRSKSHEGKLGGVQLSGSWGRSVCGDESY